MGSTGKSVLCVPIWDISHSLYLHISAAVSFSSLLCMSSCRFVVKKTRKMSQANVHALYVFLPGSVSVPYFCITFQIKYVDPFKGCPVKWTVCSLRIYFWFDRMAKHSFYVIFLKFVKCLFLNKTFCVVYCMHGKDMYK